MGGETRKGLIWNGRFDGVTESFRHDNEEEGGEWVPLSYAFGRQERSWGNSIDKDGKQSWRGEVDYPGDPIRFKVKGKESRF